MIVTCVCGKKLRIDDRLRGKRVKCPSCGNALVVEGPPNEQQSTNPPDAPPASPAVPTAPPPVNPMAQSPAPIDSDFGFDSGREPPMPRQRRSANKKPAFSPILLLAGGGVVVVGLVVVVLWLTGVFGSGASGSGNGTIAEPADILPLVADGMPGDWKLSHSPTEIKALEKAAQSYASKEQELLRILRKRGLDIGKPLRLGREAAFTGKNSNVAINPAIGIGAMRIEIKDLATNKVLQTFSENGNSFYAGPTYIGFGQQRPAQFSAKPWDPVGFGAVADVTEWEFLSTAAFSPDGETVALSGIPDLLKNVEAAKSGVVPPTVMIWQPRNETTIAKVGRFKMYYNDEPKNYRATSMAFSPDGKLLATAHAVGCVCLWEATTGNPLRIWKFIKQHPNKRPIQCSPHVAFSKDGGRIAVGGSRYLNTIESFLKVIDLTSATTRDFAVPDDLAIDDLEFTAIDKYLITFHRSNHSLQIWNVQNQKRENEIEDFRGREISVSPGGTLLIADGRLWDLSAFVKQ